MQQMIHNLRQKPEHVRRHILHVSTVVFGVALLFLWFYSLGTNLSNPETQARVQNDLQPFSALKANLIGGYKSISEPNTTTQ